MPTPDGSKLWSLQALRFVAALLVVHIHAVIFARDLTGSPGVIGSLANIGRCGVDIFFVISGVIIARTAPGVPPGVFARKRFRRVVPFYLLFSIPAVIREALDGFGWRDLLATMLWPATDVMTVPPLEIAWTLSFEMLFYAAATLVLVGRHWAYVLVGLWIGAMWLDGPVFQFVGNPIIAEFLFGVGLAYAPRWRHGAWLILPGLVAFVATAGAMPEGNTLRFLSGVDWERPFILGVPAAMVVYGAMQIEIKPGVLTTLGDASYSLYLSHGMVLLLTYLVAKALPVTADVFILVAMTMAVLFSWRIHERFEKPLLRSSFLRPRVVARGRRPEAVPVEAVQE